MARGLQRVWKGLADTRMKYLSHYKLSDLIPYTVEPDYAI